MRHLSRGQGAFTHLVVADAAFDVFTRAPLESLKLQRNKKARLGMARHSLHLAFRC